MTNDEKRKAAFKLGFEHKFNELRENIYGEESFEKNAAIPWFSDALDVNSKLLMYGLMAAVGLPLATGAALSFGKNLLLKDPINEDPDIIRKRIMLTEMHQLAEEAKKLNRGSSATTSTKKNFSEPRTLTSKGWL